MKRHNQLIPTVYSYNILKQLCNIIPPHMVPKLARKYGIEKQAKTFTPWSHVVSMLYTQLTHAIGLNDVCDALRMNSGRLSTIREATPPTCNNLSHANKTRNAEMMEELYWKMMSYLQEITPAFGKGKVRHGYVRRFKKAIHAVDSTTIQLAASCMDWAKHRRSKAAAKCHLRLNLQSFLPRCVIIETAKYHDSRKALELCGALKPGEITIFDKAYVNYKHLYALHQRDVFWVTRVKDNMQVKVVKKLKTTRYPRIIRDDIVVLSLPQSRKQYPERFRKMYIFS